MGWGWLGLRVSLMKSLAESGGGRGDACCAVEAVNTGELGADRALGQAFGSILTPGSTLAGTKLQR